MKKSLCVLMVAMLTVSLMSGCGNKNKVTEIETKPTQESSDEKSNEVEIVTISAEVKGAELTRVDNLVDAAVTLNEELKEQGKNIQVNVETSSFDGSSEDYRKRFILGFQSKKEPDIYVAAHEDIAWLAQAEYIMSLDEIKESKAYSDVYESLWNSVQWNGHTWGVPQDTEVRPIYFNVKVLKDLGWSEDKIKSLPDQVVKGEFTLEDMTTVAEEAVSKGLVKWGITHRPTMGPEFHMMAKNFGAQMYNEEEDKIVLDKPNVLKTLEYLKELTVDKKLTPDAITSMEWKNVHQLAIDGDVLFWYGGSWNIFNYVEQGADYDKMMEQFDFMLVPAAKKGGKPLTLSHPQIYTVSSQTKRPELVARLLELVAAPEYQAKHAVETSHLPINKSGASEETFIANEYMNSLVYMLDYTTFLPNNISFNKYSDAFYNAIQSVEIGKLSPVEAIDLMEKELNNTMGDKIIILN